MSYPYGPEPYPTFGTVEGDVDEPERFLQDLFALTSSPRLKPGDSLHRPDSKGTSGLS